MFSRAELPPCAAGGRCRFAISATLNLYCDTNGELRVQDRVGWGATWCEVPHEQYCYADGARAAALPSTSEPESWEFVVLGDGDVEGSFPTPDDVTACGIPTLVTEYVAPDFAQSGSIGVFADAAVVCSDHISPSNHPVRRRRAGWNDPLWDHCARKHHAAAAGFFVNGSSPTRTRARSSGHRSHKVARDFEERGDGERRSTPCRISTQPVQDIALSVNAAVPPSNQFWVYPWVDLCPLPGVGRRRMRTSTFYINPASNHDCDTPVPAIPTSWSAMKSLYAG